MGQSPSNRTRSSFVENNRRDVSLENNTASDTSLKFAFLQDEETILYMKCSKVLIILRGLPGSGKSFLAQKLKDTFGSCCQVCSVDDYFSQGTQYRFDPTKLPDAVLFCQETALQACGSGQHVVVIDDSNIELKSMNYFIHLADKTNYVQVVEEPCTAWKFDASVLAMKSRQNLREDDVYERLEFWEEIVPIYFGWFLNVSDSLSVVSIAEAYLDECINIPKFFEEFHEIMSFDGYREINDYFNLPTQDHILHCTAHFCKDRTVKDDYMMLHSVQENYGSKTSLSIVGFVVTPQTFLARIKLSSQQLKVWGQDDFEVPPIQDATDVVRSPSGIHAATSSPFSQACEPKCIATLRPYSNPDRRTKQFFCPTEGLGRRAHITLGCAKGVKPVQAGFDLMEAVELEKASASSVIPTFDIGCALVRKYGEATWVIYPYKVYVVDALFTFYMSARS